MQNSRLRALLALGLSVVVGVATSSAAGHIDSSLAAAVASPARSATAVARDSARHPVEVLTFFGLTPHSTVVELWPGSGYWTEILAPYLAAGGHYTVAQPVAGNAEEDAVVAKLHARMEKDKARYAAIHETTLGKDHYDIAPAGSADFVLTFRNLHNWMDDGYAEKALTASFTALKAGGILGIEEHRARGDVPQDPKGKNGYVRQDYTIAMAKKAGFEFVGSSEINANPRDTKDWVDGVWTLPPTLSQGDKDRAKYIVIGEADNFVLKFRKPK